ncbi:MULTISPECIES: DUF2812 domain-containing protein [Bacillaceae]|uniref:DUF2812 domain-containing protein n=1 Tax=Evansella alkalicola TaxID=745819 RepID=A0ABS6K062_9BACI|nr:MULTISPECIES: DUF2812 domain-containing protein [Bacillaceae]MBU9724223.1 DUF2812 domain-containing protein [Bacillus alkalicola]
MSKHRVIKFFINFEKEEAWLNEMAAKGLHLVHYTFGKYVFEEGKPGEYIYRLELLDNLPFHPESKDYLRFMEDNGVKHIASIFRWVYFRKKAADGPFDIYSDHASRIAHYKRICIFTVSILFINLMAALSNFSLGLGLHSTASSFNLYVSLVNFVIVIIIIPILWSYWKRLKRLKEEMQLFE